MTEPEDREIPTSQEPDYRFTLANERTYLAWLRTSLAMLAGAVAVTQLVKAEQLPWVRLVLALTLVGLSVLVAVGSVWRWRTAEQAIRSGDPLPRLRLPWIVSAGVTLIALLSLLLVLIEVRS
jgi:putative membrane protein